MLKSHVVTLSGDKKTATVEEAQIGDFFTTAFHSSKRMFGPLALVQDVGKALIGVVAERKMTVSDYFVR